MHISSRFKLTIIFSLLFLFVVGLALRGFSSTPTHAAKATHGWHLVASPLIGGSVLRAVAAVSATSAWAVGYSSNSTLIEHYNGKVWSTVPSPNVGAGVLNTVKALSTTNVWAAGTTGYNGTVLIEHYNGKLWSIVNSPYMVDSTLTGMTVLSATNIWAAGNYYNGYFGQSTLIEHYNGVQWSVIPSPDADNFNSINAINASSPTDVWVVGSHWDAEDDSGSQATLVEHYDGYQWSVVPSPTPGYDDTLNAVIALSSVDVRAVGSASSSTFALAEHWDGIQWTNGVPPNGGVTYNYLNGEVAFATNNIWAVGAYDSSYVTNTLIEHWDGAHWSIVASPNASPYYNILTGIAKVPGTTTLWAVGNSGNGALIEFYS